uniref:Uncharacterized protein n=1 Tax=Oryza sativa subsp. japonica TaxID=39947 RepID=Q5Z4Q9_ORYSJ|nr:hypothetical protein [Oryza sativa Japonica Group]
MLGAVVNSHKAHNRSGCHKAHGAAGQDLTSDFSDEVLSISAVRAHPILVELPLPSPAQVQIGASQHGSRRHSERSPLDSV